MWESATSGDAKAVDQLVRIIMARVHLLGLDQREDNQEQGQKRVVSIDWQPGTSPPPSDSGGAVP